MQTAEQRVGQRTAWLSPLLLLFMLSQCFLSWEALPFSSLPAPEPGIFEADESILQKAISMTDTQLVLNGELKQAVPSEMVVLGSAEG